MNQAVTAVVASVRLQGLRSFLHPDSLVSPREQRDRYDAAFGAVRTIAELFAAKCPERAGRAEFLTTGRAVVHMGRVSDQLVASAWQEARRLARELWSGLDVEIVSTRADVSSLKGDELRVLFHELNADPPEKRVPYARLGSGPLDDLVRGPRRSPHQGRAVTAVARLWERSEPCVPEYAPWFLEASPDGGLALARCDGDSFVAMLSAGITDWAELRSRSARASRWFSVRVREVCSRKNRNAVAVAVLLARSDDICLVGRYDSVTDACVELALDYRRTFNSGLSYAVAPVVGSLSAASKVTLNEIHRQKAGQSRAR